MLTVRQEKAPKGGYRADLITIPVNGLFDRVGVDRLSPLPVTASGNRYVVVFTDYLMKWPDIKAPRIAQVLLDNIIARHSTPHHLRYTSSNQRNWDVSLSAPLFGFRASSSPTYGESPLIYSMGEILS